MMSMQGLECCVYSFFLLFVSTCQAECNDDLITRPGQLSASSTKPGISVADVRYDCCLGKTFAAWCPDHKANGEWFNVDFDKPTLLSRVVVQRPLNPQNDVYMTSFILKVVYTTDPYSPGTLQNYQEDGNITIFKTLDNEETVFNFTDLTVRSIRMSVYEWVGEPCFRLGLYGCDGSKTCSDRPFVKDVAFVVQDDNQVGTIGFSALLQFCSELAGIFNIDFNDTRIGLIRYSNGQEMTFNLATYNSTSDVQNKVLSMSFGETTIDKTTKNISNTLMYVRDKLYTSDNGDRPNAENWIIVFLDEFDDSDEAFYNSVKQLRDDGFEIIVISWGHNLNASLIKSVLKNDNYFLQADDINNLKPLTQAVQHVICPDVEVFDRISPDEKPIITVKSSDPNLTLQCSFEMISAQQPVEYTVIWYIDDSVTKLEKSVQNFSSILHEEDMTSPSFGGEIACSVTACIIDYCKDSTGAEKRSDPFVAGIEIMTSNVTAYEGGDSVCIDIKSSVPPRLFCNMSTTDDEFACDLEISYTFATRPTATCLSGRTIPEIVFGVSHNGQSSCSVLITNMNWTSPVCLAVMAVDDALIDGDLTAIVNLISTLRVNGTEQNSTSAQIEIYIIDRDAAAICQSINDPHVTTFDGMYFDVFFEGELVFYRHTSLPFEIHTFYRQCDGFISCTCAVAIRSGDDVIVFDKCDQVTTNRYGHRLSLYPTLYLNGHITSGTSIVQYSDGKKYTVIKKYFDVFFEGELVFYRHTSLPFEIHTFYRQCDGFISCTCAVAIRSGDDVIVFDKCDQVTTNRYGHRLSLYPTLYLNGHITSGTSIVQYSDGKKYTVVLPTGGEATIEISAASPSFINVWFKASAKDYGKTVGICGTYDGNDNNDLRMPNGSQYSIPYQDFRPDEYIKTWRVGDLVEASLYRGVCTNQSDIDPLPMRSYCECSSGDLHDCDGSADIDPCNRIDADSSQNFIHGGRDITNDLVAKAEAPPTKCLTNFPDAGFIYNDTYEPPDRSWPTPSNISESAAREYCNNYITTYELYRACQNVTGLNLNWAIESCVTDIKMTDNMELSRSALASVIQRCLIIIQADTSYWQNVSGSVVPNMDILGHICPYQCSGHGLCIEATCQCDTGFGGVDCSVDISGPPEITSSLQLLCDIRQANCTSVTLYSDGFIQSDSLMCRVQKMNTLTWEPDGSATMTPAVYDSYDQVHCFLPTEIAAYNVSISNDGNLYSRWTTVILYDSSCYLCDENNCTQKIDVCIIDGTCYGNGVFLAANPVQICDTSRSTVKWTLLTNTSLSFLDYSFLYLRDSTLVTQAGNFSVLNGPLLQNEAERIFVTLNGSTQYILADALNDTCIRDLHLCFYGVTIEFYLTILELKENMYIFSNAGQRSTGRGISMYYRWGRLITTFSNAEQEWTVSTKEVLIGPFYHVMITWSKYTGLRLYLNQTVVVQNRYYVTRSINVTISGYFYIGRSADPGTFSQMRMTGWMVTEAEKDIIDSIHLSDTVPSIDTTISSVLCDIQTEPCTRVLIYGSGFINSVQLMCHFDLIQGSYYVSTNTLVNPTSLARYHNSTLVSCEVDTDISVAIRISNDGIHTSTDAAQVVVYDSSCFTCQLNSENTNVFCTLKPDACFIEDQCYTPGTFNDDNDCYLCNPVVTRSSWSYSTENRCQTRQLNVAAIVGGAVAGCLGVVVAVFACVYFVKHKKDEKYCHGKGSDNASDNNGKQLSPRQRIYYIKEGYIFYYGKKC